MQSIIGNSSRLCSGRPARRRQASLNGPSTAEKKGEPPGVRALSFLLRAGLRPAKVELTSAWP
ncbi:hypothetical protein EVA_09086 [gut metagenome]|uniref:Uncharacterized protein n=1 Tax=gut metagenome TaxID=749906 RepID=J9GKY4_9ZZZZ